MKNFFNSLFKLNMANVAKVVCGLAVGVMTAATAGLVLPVAVVGVASGVVSVGVVLGIVSGVGTTLGVHAVHVADPPIASGKICLPAGKIDPTAPIQP